MFKFRGNQMSKTKRLLTQAGSVVALCFMFVAFQNCGKQMEFSSSSLEKATLVEVPLDDNDNDVPELPDEPETDVPEVVPPVIVDNPEDDVPEDDTPGSSGSSGTNGSSGSNGSSGANGDSGSNGDVVDTPEEDGEPEENSGPKHFICILEGSGKSQKLALVDDALVSQTSACKTVCTTERACLDVVSQAFNVKSAEKRGFCKKESDEHSIHLSESQLQSIIDNNSN